MKNNKPDHIFDFFDAYLYMGFHKIPCMFFSCDNDFVIKQIVDLINSIEGNSFYPICYASLRTNAMLKNESFIFIHQIHTPTFKRDFYMKTTNIIYRGIVIIDLNDAKYFKKWIGLATYRHADRFHKLRTKNKLIITNSSGSIAYSKWNTLACLIRAIIHSDMYTLADRYMHE